MGPRRAAAAVLLVAGLGAGTSAGDRPKAKTAPPDEVVALVDGQPVTRGNLARSAEPRLIEARTRAYEIEREVLDELIAERLVREEARRRGLTPEALLKAEVEAKAVPPRPWDVEAHLRAHARAYQGKDREESVRAAEATVRADRIVQRRIGFLNALRAAADVRVTLEPPRVAVGPGTAAVRGPLEARVTLVEFADFQCPFCGRLAASLKRLQQRQPGEVRLAFRHFPLDVHRHAAKAAEAAECAREQGRFWEMHDRLFEVQSRLEARELKAQARALGLDVAAFDRCLDGGLMAPRWREDRRVAESFGLSATPMLFVNGRLLVGARPDAEIFRIVEGASGPPLAHWPGQVMFGLASPQARNVFPVDGVVNCWQVRPEAQSPSLEQRSHRLPPLSPQP